MSEEVENAAVNIPRAIIGSMLINGTVGFVMMLTLLFCLGDVDSVLESATGYPFIQVFYSKPNQLEPTKRASRLLKLTLSSQTASRVLPEPR
jgi:amino acid transporter